MRVIPAIVGALIFVLSFVIPVYSQTPQASQLETEVNDARVAAGGLHLNIDSRLENSAMQKVLHMQSSHCYLPRCVNSFSVAERANAAGYPGGFVSELIDTDHTTAQDVIDFWMIEGLSPRFFITLPQFTDLGCAYGMDGSTPLWVCDFGQQVTITDPTATPIPPATPAPPTATSVPPTATATMFPPTWTSVPLTATVRGTPVPVEQLGECATVWYADNHGGTVARFTGRMTQFQCVRF